MPLSSKRYYCFTIQTAFTQKLVSEGRREPFYRVDGGGGGDSGGG